ncbi:hypothetical protein TNCT_172361 [Trichonephila clavata]|uniref:Uncharacterized protein n=1 Tax=Trichonephila clavata TaxID=2740835 RepID=A0A8X6LCF2_TRICU|nr:hypothetical protein TNCT_172361 [Trichonephila clavata]
MAHYQLKNILNYWKKNWQNINLTYVHTDIVAKMTDGASVMKKMGRILSVDQQLCLAHGLQLVVIDALYNKLENEPDRQNNEEEIYFTERVTPVRKKIFLTVKDSP